MRVVVTIQHPAHVHFFKNAIWELEDRGHEVHVFAREKEVALDLLEAYDIPHTVLAGKAEGLGALAKTQFAYESRLLKHARRLNPDVMTAIGGVAVSHVSKLVGARSVVFYDTEHATLISRLAFPFADDVFVPESYYEDAASDVHRYPGYHELAYLHPSRFTPDASILDELDQNVGPDGRLVVLRLVSWGASHDVGREGLGHEKIGEFVERLERDGATVVVTSEVPLPEELEHCRASIEPHRMHHLLARADLFIGEGATMAAESAVLGTPAIYVNDLAMGYTDELEERYGLLFNVRGRNARATAYATAVDVLEEPPGTWEQRRNRLLAEKVDTTDVILDAVLEEGTPRLTDRVETTRETAVTR